VFENEGADMELDKDTVVKFIREQLGGEKAGQAENELPDKVDTERDAGLLQKFGVDPKDLLGKLGGLGGLGDKLGL
jgi:hypothetical protein